MRRRFFIISLSTNGTDAQRQGCVSTRASPFARAPKPSSQVAAFAVRETALSDTACPARKEREKRGTPRRSRIGARGSRSRHKDVPRAPANAPASVCDAARARAPCVSGKPARAQRQMFWIAGCGLAVAVLGAALAGVRAAVLRSSDRERTSSASRSNAIPPALACAMAARRNTSNPPIRAPRADAQGDYDAIFHHRFVYTATAATAALLRPQSARARLRRSLTASPRDVHTTRACAGSCSRSDALTRCGGGGHRTPVGRRARDLAVFVGCVRVGARDAAVSTLSRTRKNARHWPGVFVVNRVPGLARFAARISSPA